jgi:hypothetical protein
MLVLFYLRPISARAVSSGRGSDSLCNLCVLCISVVSVSSIFIHHGETVDAQRF